jgi:hypothetical protein
MSTNNNSFLKWLRENIWSILVATFMAGSVYTAMEVKNSWRDEKISYLKEENRLQQEKIEALRDLSASHTWKIDQNITSISNLQTDNRTTQNAVSEIKSQISVLSTKMDNIIELLKKDKRP